MLAYIPLDQFFEYFAQYADDGYGAIIIRLTWWLYFRQRFDDSRFPKMWCSCLLNVGVKNLRSKTYLIYYTSQQWMSETNLLWGRVYSAHDHKNCYIPLKSKIVGRLNHGILNTPISIASFDANCIISFHNIWGPHIF